jgi:hypothetical protein
VCLSLECRRRRLDGYQRPPRQGGSGGDLPPRRRYHPRRCRHLPCGRQIVLGCTSCQLPDLAVSPIGRFPGARISQMPSRHHEHRTREADHGQQDPRPAAKPHDHPGLESGQTRLTLHQTSRCLARLPTDLSAASRSGRLRRPASGSSIGCRRKTGRRRTDIEFPITGDLGLSRQPIQFNRPHTQQNLRGERHWLNVSDKRNFKRGALGVRLVRISDCGLPLPLACQLVELLVALADLRPYPRVSGTRCPAPPRRSEPNPAEMHCRTRLQTGDPGGNRHDPCLLSGLSA